MSEKKIYKEYFDIDPKYYAAVTADLIKQAGKTFIHTKHLLNYWRRHIRCCQEKTHVLFG